MCVPMSGGVGMKKGQSWTCVTHSVNTIGGRGRGSKDEMCAKTGDRGGTGSKLKAGAGEDQAARHNRGDDGGWRRGTEGTNKREQARAGPPRRAGGLFIFVFFLVCFLIYIVFLYLFFFFFLLLLRENGFIVFSCCNFWQAVSSLVKTMCDWSGVLSGCITCTSSKADTGVGKHCLQYWALRTCSPHSFNQCVGLSEWHKPQLCSFFYFRLMGTHICPLPWMSSSPNNSTEDSPVFVCLHLFAPT